MMPSSEHQLCYNTDFWFSLGTLPAPELGLKVMIRYLMKIPPMNDVHPEAHPPPLNTLRSDENSCLARPKNTVHKSSAGQA